MSRPLEGARRRVPLTISVHADVADALRQHPGHAGRLVDAGVAALLGLALDGAPPLVAAERPALPARAPAAPRRPRKGRSLPVEQALAQAVHALDPQASEALYTYVTHPDQLKEGDSKRLIGPPAQARMARLGLDAPVGAIFVTKEYLEIASQIDVAETQRILTEREDARRAYIRQFGAVEIPGKNAQEIDEFIKRETRAMMQRADEDF